MNSEKRPPTYDEILTQLIEREREDLHAAEGSFTSRELCIRLELDPTKNADRDLTKRILNRWIRQGLAERRGHKRDVYEDGSERFNPAYRLIVKEEKCDQES